VAAAVLARGGRYPVEVRVRVSLPRVGSAGGGRFVVREREKERERKRERERETWPTSS
jgi:hypothetical protein